MAIHGFALTGFHAGDPFHEAGDHAAFFQFDLQAVGASASNGFRGVCEDPAEAHHRHIAGGCGPIADWHQGCKLPSGLLDEFVDAIGVVVDPYGLGLEALDAFQRRGRSYIHLQVQHQLLGWIELLQQVFKASAQLRLPKDLQLFLRHGIPQHGIHEFL